MSFFKPFQKHPLAWPWEKIVIFLAILFSALSIGYAIQTDTVIAYGDAESHLNIAKRVVTSLTPGAAQLGGVWLPLPHILMLPFVYSDFMWRTGLAGAFISGAAYVVAGVILFKLTYLLTKNTLAALIAFLFFALNPNVLYLQATPMTEVPFIAFFLLSVYFFVKYLKDNQNYLAIISAAFFTFCATLSRYDGWALFGIETSLFFLQYLFKSARWKETEARLVLFSTLAVFGIFLWLAWGGFILHDPFYFTNSSFSAKSQQQGWLANGELPSYHNVPMALYNYAITVIANVGLISSGIAVLGIILFLFLYKEKSKFLLFLLFFTPFLFNVYALFAGQSALFVPDFTPKGYEWHLFNARYGTIMISVFAFFVAYLFSQFNRLGRGLIVVLIAMQLVLFYRGIVPVTTYDDAIAGLSAESKPDSYYWKWVYDNYDGGKVLMDDYVRSVSIIKSGIPMQNIIYIGSKPYYQQSFQQPQKYARWIFIRQGDDVWNNIYIKPQSRKLLDLYFTKALATQDLMIYKRKDTITAKIQ